MAAHVGSQVVVFGVKEAMNFGFAATPKAVEHVGVTATHVLNVGGGAVEGIDGTCPCALHVLCSPLNESHAQEATMKACMHIPSSSSLLTSSASSTFFPSSSLLDSSPLKSLPLPTPSLMNINPSFLRDSGAPVFLLQAFAWDPWATAAVEPLVAVVCLLIFLVMLAAFFLVVLVVVLVVLLAAVLAVLLVAAEPF